MLCHDEMRRLSDCAAWPSTKEISSSYDLTDQVIYDSGAYAVAWAINHAKVTSFEYVNSKTKGFWRRVVPWSGYDYGTGMPGNCPEGKGWKQAWTAFTGYETMAEFYSAFDKFVGDIVATGTEDEQIAKLKAILETVWQAMILMLFSASLLRKLCVL